MSRDPDSHPYEDLKAYSLEHGQLDKLSEWAANYRALYRRGDAGQPRSSLRETLRRANEPSAAARGYGQYLVGAFKVGVGNAYPGVDFVTRWFNRNLRIFANLQHIPGGPDDRLLLIIGWGHVSILRGCAEASPEHELVEVADYL